MSENIDPQLNILIYINDELGEDVQDLFSDIELIGEIENQYARERGTMVYLCKNPKENFREFWRERVLMVRNN
ncbi:MAG: hypothetical protein R2788_17405 [Saprospiraceae bacterium]